MPHAVGGGKHRRRHERHEPGSLPHSEARTRGLRRNRGASGPTHRALVAGRRRRARVHGGGRRDGRAPPRRLGNRGSAAASRRVFRRIRFGPVTRRGASADTERACNVPLRPPEPAGQGQARPRGVPRRRPDAAPALQRAARAVHVEAREGFQGVRGSDNLPGAGGQVVPAGHARVPPAHHRAAGHALRAARAQLAAKPHQRVDPAAQSRRVRAGRLAPALLQDVSVRG